MESNNLILIDINKFFEGVKAVDRVNVEFQSGRIIGLIGPNGAGKTTLFNLISGFIQPDSGEIYWKSKKISGITPWIIAQQGIGRLFQDVRIFRKITVLENVLLGKTNIGEYPLDLIFKHRKIKTQEKENVEKAREWLTFVGIEGNENTLAENLSYGQQKLLAIARLLMAESEFLLLDEPTAGINPAMVKNLLSLIKKIVEGGKTIIFIEHNMNVVLEIAHWVYFLDEGKITAFGRPEDVLGNSEIRLTYLGL